MPRRFSFLANSGYSGGSPLRSRRASSAPVSVGIVSREIARMIVRANRNTLCQFRASPPARAGGGPELTVRFLEYSTIIGSLEAKPRAELNLPLRVGGGKPERLILS